MAHAVRYVFEERKKKKRIQIGLIYKLIITELKFIL